MTSPRFISSFKRHSPSASLWRHTHMCTQACIQSYVQTAYWSSSCNLFSSLKNAQLYSISVVNWDNWNNVEKWLLPCAVWYCFCPSCQSLCLSFFAFHILKPFPEHTVNTLQRRIVWDCFLVKESSTLQIFQRDTLQKECFSKEYTGDLFTCHFQSCELHWILHFSLLHCREMASRLGAEVRQKQTFYNLAEWSLKRHIFTWFNNLQYAKVCFSGMLTK